MSPQSDGFPFLNQGERAIVVGKTGTGKSWLARWLAERSSGPWIVINPKDTKAFNSFGVKMTKIDVQKIEKFLKEGHNVNLVPNPRDCDPELLDSILEDLCSNLKNFSVIIDEAYSLHNKAGNCGFGLTALLTRGRELGQTAIICTQRPSRISLFSISEANYYAILPLGYHKDREKLAEAAEKKELEKRISGKHNWIWFDTDNETIKKYAPIPLDNLK